MSSFLSYRSPNSCELAWKPQKRAKNVEQVWESNLYYILIQNHASRLENALAFLIEYISLIDREKKKEN